MSYSVFAILFAAIPLFVYGIFSALVLYNNIRIGKRLAENSPAFSRDGEYPSHILVVGDSLAVGVGAFGVLTIAERLAHMLNASVENKAQVGAKMKDIEAQIQSSSKQHYDYIFIIGGANDIIQETAHGELKDAIRAAYGASRLKSERVVAFTAGDVGKAPFFIFPLNYFVSKYCIETRPFFVDIAKELGVEYINLMEYPLVFDTDAPRYYAEDLLHLSADGYGVWYEYTKERLQKVWNLQDKTPEKILELEKSAIDWKKQETQPVQPEHEQQKQGVPAPAPAPGGEIPKQ